MIAKLHIRTEHNGVSSVLKEVYSTTPFKIVDITEEKRSAHLDIMIMSSSPGVLDGDEYDISINVGDNTNVNLQTQSYQRLFNMTGSAKQHATFTIGENAVLRYIPHPSVPHESSSYTAVNTFKLCSNSGLIFGEILTCGRKLNGEVFKFSKYHAISAIYIDDTLSIKENLLIEPKKIDVNALGQLEGFTHQATLICIHENIVADEVYNYVVRITEKDKDICFGVSAAPGNAVIIRMLGQKAEYLFSYLNQIANTLQPIMQKEKVYAD